MRGSRVTSLPDGHTDRETPLAATSSNGVTRALIKRSTAVVDPVSNADVICSTFIIED